MQRIKLPLGGTNEIVTILRHDDGRYPCPVCGVLYPSDYAPWGETFGGDEHGNIVTGPMAGGSFDYCLCCDTQWGNDDVWHGKTMDARWTELRIEWLNKVGWNPEALAQLKNLEIDPEKLRNENCV